MNQLVQSAGAPQAEDLSLGQWFWVKEMAAWSHDGREKGDKYEWLGCVVRIGSNYIEVQSPPDGNGSHHNERVHFDKFWDKLRAEPDADAVIQARVNHAQQHVNSLMRQVQEITQRLGVVPKQQITQAGGVDHGGSLAVITEQVDAGAYKASLVKAKDTDLPELFKQIEAGHKTLVSWMSALALPARAMAGEMKGVIGTIEDRLFTVSLYAGLTEEVVQCCEGEPAAMGEPLRIMQRRLYMDEECLVSYVPGGIDIKSVHQFDAWISQPENRDRLLPFPRTLAAFRVRRFEKEREGDTLYQMYVNVQLAQADKTTFLYVRNGDQVWRIDCDFVFGSAIFPNETGLGIEPMMINTKWSKIEWMTRREYDDRLLKREEEKRKYDQWNLDNPDEKNKSFHNPYRTYDSFEPQYWEPFDGNSTHYDDGVAELQATDKQHNRLAVIVQGLYDRSMVLHPHPPVKVWDPHSFERSVVLVRDAEALAGGDPPDFEAYRRRLNASIGVGSIVTGQQEAWLRHEAMKENKRQANNWRVRDPQTYTRFNPYGNDGPGMIAKVVEWKPRSRKATFTWKRTMQSRDHWGQKADVSVEVSADSLLNISAYTPGDYKLFLSDHRTRQQYLRWAPLMLAAEDFHAGKKTFQGPGYEDV